MEGDLGWCRGSGGGSSSNNWDLHAVVRFACGGGPGLQAGAAPSDDSFSCPLPTQQPQWHDDPAIDELVQALLAAHEPEAEAPQQPSPRNEEAPPPTQQPKPRGSGRGGGGPTRSKRKSKKSQVSKEVTRVPVGAPSADLWAWRKYGQKPIKGSPYPRGYYRCSTDKDCKARKQVERCRADPATLIVTYTGEHSHPVPLHRNSLAGTTRTKPSHQQQQAPSESTSAPSPADDDRTGTTANKPQGSPASTACVGLSPATPLRSPSVVSAEDDALLFLHLPDEPAPVLGNKPDEPVPAHGSDDVMLFPADNKPDELGPAPVSSGSGGADGVMLFPNPGEPQPTTVSAGTAPAMDFVEEKFSISGLSAWEAASSWGL